MSQCIICLDDIENIDSTVIQCFCKTCICKSCFESYMNASGSQLNKLPVCPYCTNEFLYDDLKGKEILNEYILYLFKYVRKNPNFMTIINEKIKINNLIASIRNRKVQYFETLPLAMKILTEIAFKDKMKAIMKDNKEHLESIQAKGKKCFSGLCQFGKIFETEEGDFLCDTCHGIFCKDCNKEKLDHHVCKLDDLQSVAYLKTLQKCPNLSCGADIIKIDGCSQLTCVNCHTNFHQDLEGEATPTTESAGSYRDKLVNFKTNNVFSLVKDLSSSKYSNEIMKIITDYENSKPKIISSEILIPYVQKENIDSLEELHEFFSDYSYYISSVKNVKKFFTDLYAIRQLHIDNNLTLETLSEIIPV